MATRLKLISSQVKVLRPIKYGNDELNCSFYHNAYTPRLERESTESNTSAGGILIAMLLPVLAEWDMYNDYEVYQYTKVHTPIEEPIDDILFVINGPAGKLGEWHKYITREEDGINVQYVMTPVFTNGEQLREERIIPITEQGLLDVPLNVMTDILKAIGEQVSPGEEKSFNSESSF